MANHSTHVDVQQQIMAEQLQLPELFCAHAVMHDVSISNYSTTALFVQVASVCWSVAIEDCSVLMKQAVAGHVHVSWLQVDYAAFMCRRRTRTDRLLYLRSLLSSHCSLTELPV